MARILVTGGAGFIGSNFVRFWRGRHPADELVVLDALTYAGNAANLAGLEEDEGFSFIRGDIRDFERVATLLLDRELDTIVHFAAESHVDRSIHGPDAFIETNVLGTHSLLKAAKSAWLDTGSGRAHRFHHVSTDEVYGSLAPNEPPFTESSPYAPNSPYSASKAASDHLVRAYNRTYGLETTITNCSNNYGPYQFPEKLIPLFILNVLHGKPLPIYGDGGNVRDWLYVEDHCRGIERVLDSGRVGEMYNIGGECEMTNLALVDVLSANIDAAFERNPTLAERFPDAPPACGRLSATLKSFVMDRPGHDRRYAIDTRKILAELEVAPTWTLKEGLERTIIWYLDNEAWWRAVLDGRYRQWVEKQYGA